MILASAGVLASSLSCGGGEFAKSGDATTSAGAGGGASSSGGAPTTGGSGGSGQSCPPDSTCAPTVPPGWIGPAIVIALYAATHSRLAALAIALPYAWALVDPDRRFLHDRIAGSRLLAEK